MKLSAAQVDAMRHAALDGFRRERLRDLSARGFVVDKVEGRPAFSVRDAAGSVAVLELQGATTSVTSAEGRTLVVEQHPTGRIQRVSDGLGRVVRADRAADGRLVALDRGHGSVFRFDVTPDDRLRSLTYPDGTTTHTEFDSMGRPTIVTDRNGNHIRYSYEETGLLTRVVDARGNEARIEYGDWDAPSAIEYANGTRHEFDYGEQGDLRSMRANGQLHARYHHDPTLQTYDVSYEDGTFARFRFDGKNLVEASNDEGTIQFEYDEQGRLTKESSSGKVVCYVRNAVGALVAIETPAGEQIQFERDRDQRLCGVVDWAGQHYALSGDLSGSPTAIQYPNGVTLSTSLTAMGLCASWRLCGRVADGAPSLDECKFEYDACDRMTSAVRSPRRGAIALSL